MDKKPNPGKQVLLGNGSAAANPEEQLLNDLDPSEELRHAKFDPGENRYLSENAGEDT